MCTGSHGVAQLVLIPWLPSVLSQPLPARRTPLCSTWILHHYSLQPRQWICKYHYINWQLQFSVLSQHWGFWAVNRKAKKLWPVGDQYKIILYFPFPPWHCRSWGCAARVILFFCETLSISLSSNSLLTQVQIKILQHTNPSACCWSAGEEWWKQKGKIENIFCFQMPSAYGWFCFFHGSSYFHVKYWVRDLRRIFCSFLANLGRR